ncbi:hypothetical protein MUG91_G213n6 [Manis pentadactyla]|nr:hypothetical protein MUG91_G213n6 [Manis pentadactyla]
MAGQIGSISHLKSDMLMNIMPCIRFFSVENVVNVFPISSLKKKNSSGRIINGAFMGCRTGNEVVQIGANLNATKGLTLELVSIPQLTDNYKFVKSSGFEELKPDDCILILDA